jgi:hypothetical protein
VPSSAATNSTPQAAQENRERHHKKRGCSAHAAQEPVSQENRRARLNDRSRVLGTKKCQNWTGIGNDRFGELDGNFWLTMSDRLRCSADRQFEKMIFTAE